MYVEARFLHRGYVATTSILLLILAPSVVYTGMIPQTVGLIKRGLYVIKLIRIRLTI